MEVTVKFDLLREEDKRIYADYMQVKGKYIQIEVIEDKLRTLVKKINIISKEPYGILIDDEKYKEMVNYTNNKIVPLFD